MNIYEKLLKIQVELKAPKNQYNSFGKYNYRSCEDILEGVKPLLKEVNAVLTVNDTIEYIDGRHYVKATATIIDCETSDKIENTAYAREEESKKGMDSSQVTGATSSYARKYALNGLFCIDDVKDADSMDNSNKQGKEPHVCAKCGKEIKGFTSQGKTYTDEQAWDFALKRGNGQALCGYCAKK
ncbi:ERF family protein [Anaerosporobacter faecicola]|uniref:ERF family protein n=1 Tax=Anaerosporobacter faecicola TaxID=2718714 RepID=UPI001439856C|nr:ERF family protein [Anaerosporobacter faecicola]